MRLTARFGMQRNQQRLEISFFGWRIRADGVIGIVGASYHIDHVADRFANGRYRRMAFTLAELVEQYRTDRFSPHRQLSYGVRVKHERLLDRIVRERGYERLRDVGGRALLHWHRDW